MNNIICSHGRREEGASYHIELQQMIPKEFRYLCCFYRFVHTYYYCYKADLLVFVFLPCHVLFFKIVMMTCSYLFITMHLDKRLNHVNH